MRPMTSKNCVAGRIVKGPVAAFTASSWASFARKYPLSCSRSVPTTDSTTWWFGSPRPQFPRPGCCETRSGRSPGPHRRPARGVRYVDDNLGALKCFGQAFAGERVDARVRRRPERFVAVLAQLLDELRPNEAASADDNDRHLGPFRRLINAVA